MEVFNILYKNEKPKKTDNTLINEMIRFREVRLIGDDGHQYGIVSSREAQNIARNDGFDLD